MNKAIQRIQNFYPAPSRFSSPISGDAAYMHQVMPGQQPNTKSPVFSVARVQFERIKADILLWRRAVQTAERAYNPNRADMQKILQDTGLNEHVSSCVEKRKDLTLLRKFKMIDNEGNVNVEVTELLNKTWFNSFQSYCLDALFYGYNLISLGDVELDQFQNVSFVPRENVNPDKLIVSRFIYSLTGQRFDEDGFEKWFIYIKTPTTTGKTQCGYGIFYTIAKTEIYIRNNSGQNADYNEMYGQPIRVGKTTKIGEERERYAEDLKNMGSNAWFLMDDVGDDIKLESAPGTGTAYMTYADFEKRCEAKISKMILGHSDALDSTAGKLGATQGDKSPAELALQDKQTKDGEFLEPIINYQLLPRMKQIGFNIPDGLHFEYINDGEKEEFRTREDESNTKTAGLMKAIDSAGGELSDETWKWFGLRTGIPGVTKKEAPEPIANPVVPMKVAPKRVAALQDQLRKATGFKRENIKSLLKSIHHDQA